MDLSTDGEGAVLLPVKVVPGARRTQCVGVLGDRLKIAVLSPPERGKANAELVEFVARTIGVRRGDVTVHRGHNSPRKTLRIENATVDQVRLALQIGD